MTEEDQDKDIEGEKKTFNFWLLLNWKTGNIKLYKTEPKSKKVGAYHIKIEQSLDVIVPDKPDIKAKGKIKLGKDKVEDMVIESI